MEGNFPCRRCRGNLLYSPAPGSVQFVQPVNSRRAIALLYVVLLTVCGVGTGALFLEARAEYNALKEKQAAGARELAAAKQRLADQERFLERLRSDPILVEKVIRQRLGYGRPGEVIFRFDSEL